MAQQLLPATRGQPGEVGSSPPHSTQSTIWGSLFGQRIRKKALLLLSFQTSELAGEGNVFFPCSLVQGVPKSKALKEDKCDFFSVLLIVLCAVANLLLCGGTKP